MTTRMEYERARNQDVAIDGVPVLPFCAKRECWVRPGGEILRDEQKARRYARRLMEERERLEGEWLLRHGSPRW